MGLLWLFSREAKLLVWQDQTKIEDFHKNEKGEWIIAFAKRRLSEGRF
jgi:hypothetical protein